VLNLDWAWISDESSLWDFHASDDNRALIVRISEVYAVNVSNIESPQPRVLHPRPADRFAASHPGSNNLGDLERL
jgi:hypothetical protein